MRGKERKSISKCNTQYKISLGNQNNNRNTCAMPNNRFSVKKRNEKNTHTHSVPILLGSSQKKYLFDWISNSNAHKCDNGFHLLLLLDCLLPYPITFFFHMQNDLLLFKNNIFNDSYIAIFVSVLFKRLRKFEVSFFYSAGRIYCFCLFFFTKKKTKKIILFPEHLKREHI